jgi:hypothetical protein
MNWKITIRPQRNGDIVVRTVSRAEDRLAPKIADAIEKLLTKHLTAAAR